MHNIDVGFPRIILVFLYVLRLRQPRTNERLIFVA
jgi:hypothetical protein